MTASRPPLSKYKSASDERIFVAQSFDDDACMRENFFGAVAGDFGSAVTCAFQHHFFLDITFY
jgi:hypothetical protein